MTEENRETMTPCAAIRSMATGESLRFPLERYRYIRSLAYSPERGDKKYQITTDRAHGIMTVTRVN